MVDCGKVSIIIPIYNTEKYLAPCINSILEQTYTNWELFLIDDGSTDNSLSICMEYQNKDARITVLTQKNSRVGAARNKGLDYATGDYITFVDSDDMADKHLLERALEIVNRTEASVVQWEAHFFRTNDDNVYDIGKDTDMYSEHVEIETSPMEAIDLMLDNKGRGADPRFRMLRNSCRCVWTKLCKASVFSTLRFPIDREYEDDFIVHHIFYNAQNKIVFINDELTNKREHQNSVLHTMSFKGKKDHLECEYERLLFVKEHGFEKQTINHAVHIYFTSMLELTSQAILEKRDDALSKIHRRAKEHYRFYFSNLNKLDKLVVGVFCLAPRVGGRVYMMYRWLKG